MHPSSIRHSTAIGLLCALASASSAFSANVTWDAANNNWTSTTLGGQAWADYDSAIFNTAGDHAITVGAGVLVGKPTSDNGVALNIQSGNYTFTGPSLTFRNADGAGGGDMDLLISNSSTVTFDTDIVSTNSGGSFRLLPQGGDATVNINGDFSVGHNVLLGNFNDAVINLNVGGLSTSTISSNGLISTSNLTVGNAAVTTTSLTLWKNSFAVNDANAVVNVTNDWDDVVKAGQSNEALSVVSVQNGAMNLALGGIAITQANRNAGDSGTIDGVGRLEISGGTLNVAKDIALVRADKADAIGNGQYVQSGGVVTARGIVSGQSNNGTNVANGVGSVGSITITGGELYLGTNGMNKNAFGPDTVNVSVSGGTIGATANWSSNMDMTLGTTNGNITFKAANQAGDTASDIALNGALSGTGGLTKTGAGTLTLSGLNTYTGNTVVSAGAFNLADGGQLVFDIGLSGVNNSVTGAGSATFDGDFVFNLLDPLATSGTWVIADVDTQSFGGTFSVDGWTQAGDTFTFNNYVFDTNTGVLTAVPEPSAYALVGVAMLGLAALRARRRAQR